MLATKAIKLLNEYAENNTSCESNLLANLKQFTTTNVSQPQMLCGKVTGKLLQLLTIATNAKNVLEIGMFTGYSTLSIAEALPTDGKLISCDINSKNAAIAKKYFQQSPHGHKITIVIGNAIETIKNINLELDLVFIDADKINYDNYYEAILNKLKPKGMIIFDNMLYDGKVLNPDSKNSRDLHYLNQKLTNDPRVDNVLLTIRDGIQLVVKK